MSIRRKILLGGLLPILAVGLYALMSYMSRAPYFPTITVIAEKFAALWLSERGLNNIVPSLTNFIVGYLAAVVSGIPLGLLLGRVRWAGDVVLPLLHFARSVPPLMLIPPFVLVLGIGDLSKVAIIAFGALFPILLATLDGVRATDATLIDAARTMHLRAWQKLVHVWIPSSAPSMFGGLQTGLQFALVLMVASEIIAAIRGVGFVTMQAQQTFDAPGVWAGIVLLAVIGFTFNSIFVRVRNRALAWDLALRAQAKAP